MSWYTRTVLLLMKSNCISELLLLPMKRNDDLEQFTNLMLIKCPGILELVCYLRKVMKYKNFFAAYEKL